MSKTTARDITRRAKKRGMRKRCDCVQDNRTEERRMPGKKHSTCCLSRTLPCNVFLGEILGRRRRLMICQRPSTSTSAPHSLYWSNTLTTHHKCHHTAHSKTLLPVPALAHLATVHTPSPSVETTYNRSKTEDTVPRSSIHTHPVRPRPHHPRNAHSTASVHVGTTSRCEVGVARRSIPCCTFEAKRT